MISFGGVETTCKVLYKEYIIPQASTIICNIQDYTIKITSQKGMHYTNSQVTKSISNRTLNFFKFLQCMHVRITTVHLLFLPLTTL